MKRKKLSKHIEMVTIMQTRMRTTSHSYCLQSDRCQMPKILIWEHWIKQILSMACAKTDRQSIAHMYWIFCIASILIITSKIIIILSLEPLLYIYNIKYQIHIERCTICYMMDIDSANRTHQPLVLLGNKVGYSRNDITSIDGH